MPHLFEMPEADELFALFVPEPEAQRSEAGEKRERFYLLKTSGAPCGIVPGCNLEFARSDDECGDNLYWPENHCRIFGSL